MRSTFLLAAIAVALAGTSVGCQDPNPSDEGKGEAPPVDPNSPEGQNIPSEGETTSGLEAVDDAIKAWMRATCTGAVTFALGFDGKPLTAKGYGHKYGPPNAACGKGSDVYTNALDVMPETPMRIGSNSKAITAAIVRIVLKQKLAALGRPTTDAEVESLPVFDADLDLVSARFRRAVSSNLATGTAACTAIDGGVSEIVAGGRVDPRWTSMTVGQLLGHRSGLPRGGNPVTAKLAAIRGIDSLEKLEAESALAGATPTTQSALDEKISGARFIRQSTLEEYLVGNVDLCLTYPPGGPLPAISGFNPYSNMAYGILQHIAEHVSGRTLTAPLGAPGDHPESLLAQFNETRLGFTKGVRSKYGIYAAQPIINLRDLAEPSYRGWDGQSLVGKFADVKRPFCVWNEGTSTCDTSAFTNGSVRYHWQWKNELVDVGYENEGFAAGPGLIVVEAPLMLKFMAKYWVEGAGSVPLYGRERATSPSATTRWHLGALRGTDSTVAQFAGDQVPYFVVPRKDGELDLATFEKYPADAPPDAQCKLPKGLDMVLTANQHDDKACAGQSTTVCAYRYMALRDVVKEALCKVSWQKVHPQLAAK
ncbi:MAG: serine hydrolase [Labilithrix sp.]|nr:serine hydrolase [Labilithrix sp.]